MSAAREEEGRGGVEVWGSGMPVWLKGAEFLLPGAVVAVAAAVLALFPALGNQLALLSTWPRRLCQGGIALTALAMAAWGLSRLGAAGALRRGGWRRAALAAGAAGALLLAAVLPPLMRGALPSGYGVAAWFSAWAWAATALFAASGGGALPAASPAHQPEPSSGGGAVQGALLTPLPAQSGVLPTGLLVVPLGALAAGAYLWGPDPGEPFVSFGGSTTQVGLAGGVGVGLGLAVLRGGWRVLAALLGLYLILVSTARTPVLVVLAFLGGLTAARVWRPPGGLRVALGRSFRDLALVAACAAVLGLLVQPWTYFPYLSSRPEQQREQEYFQARYLRWERLAGRPRAAGGWAENGPQPIAPREARIELYLRTLQVIASSPLGSWPQPFAERVTLDCGVPGISSYPCGYPHNLLLEVGYFFGWAPMALLALALPVWLWRVFRSLAAAPGGPAGVAGVGLVAWCVYAQVSGNLVDHLLTLALGWLWLVASALEAGGGAEAAGHGSGAGG